LLTNNLGELEPCSLVLEDTLELEVILLEAATSNNNLAITSSSSYHKNLVIQIVM